MEKIKDIQNTQFILFKKVSLIDKYNFYEYLSVMLDWWVSVTESLESVERLEGQNQIWNKPQTDLNDQRLRGVLLEVIKRIFGREKCLWGIVYDWIW